ncbi:DNA ligase 1-like [Saccostrea echinata]|uniref:DNA ligase 1-like n=1 Tax=Saccostrea echinata TaxID=191078 RepID=UPI002A808E86|nr:DNA ligase 1-like [Saccostrea echinata]
MSDTEMDKEEKIPQEETTDSKNESDIKNEESPPKKEETTPRKSVTEAPAVKPEKTKEKDEKREQQKSKEEPVEEQKQENDDDKKDDDTGTRKVTFDSRDINSAKDTHIGSDANGAENGARNDDDTETETNRKNLPEQTTPEKNDTMNLEDVYSDSDSEKQTTDKDKLDSNTNPEVAQKSSTNGLEPDQNKGKLESGTPEDNALDSNVSVEQEKKTRNDSEPSQKDEKLEPTSGDKVTSEKSEEAEKSETRDSGYVPLDKLWSSPKREFKGVQREYSFEYRRSTSTSSYTAQKQEEEDQSEKKSESDKLKTDVKGSESDKAKTDVEGGQTENKVDSIQISNNKDSPTDSSDKYISDKDKSDSTTESLNASDKNEIKEEIVKSDNESPKKTSDESRKPVHGEYQTEPSPKQEIQSESTKSSQKEEDLERKDEPKFEKEEDDQDDWRFDDRKSSDGGSEEARSDDEHIKHDDNRNEEEITIPKADKEDDYEEEKFESESDDNISVEDTTPYKEEPKEEPKSESKKEPAKQSKGGPAKKTKEQPKKRPQPSPSPRPSSQPNRNLQRPVAKSAQVTSRPSDGRRALSPAQMRTPRSQTNTPRSKQRPQTTPGAPRRQSRIASEDGQKRQKEFFRAELSRLQKSLKDESSKIHKPKQREHYPFVWTSLEPYYNTYVARFLIDAQEEAIFHPKARRSFPETERPQTRGRPVSRGKLYAEDPTPGYVSRNTAIGLCDPWTDLRMDRELLPRLETPTKKSRTRAMQKEQKPKKKEKPPKQGSTRLPKFPVVDFSSSKENATKRFPYSEVPKFRQEVMGRYKHDAPKKLNSDYSRTRDDFYRMDLDRLDEVHPINRPHMRKAYFAYLQNTPGSKKAINECVKGLNNDQAQKAN